MLFLIIVYFSRSTMKDSSIFVSLDQSKRSRVCFATITMARLRYFIKMLISSIQGCLIALITTFTGCEWFKERDNDEDIERQG